MGDQPVRRHLSHKIGGNGRGFTRARKERRDGLSGGELLVRRLCWPHLWAEELGDSGYSGATGQGSWGALRVPGQEGGRGKLRGSVERGSRCGADSRGHASDGRRCGSTQPAGTASPNRKSAGADELCETDSCSNGGKRTLFFGGDLLATEDGSRSHESGPRRDLDDAGCGGRLPCGGIGERHDADSANAKGCGVELFSRAKRRSLR